MLRLCIGEEERTVSVAQGTLKNVDVVVQDVKLLLTEPEETLVAEFNDAKVLLDVFLESLKSKNQLQFIWPISNKELKKR